MGRATTLIAAIGVSAGSFSITSHAAAHVQQAALVTVIGQTQSETPSTEELIHDATNHFRMGEFESASQVLDRAASQPNLSAKDRTLIGKYQEMVFNTSTDQSEESKQAKVAAVQLLNQAEKSLAEGNIQQATAYAQSAKSSDARFFAHEVSPDQMLKQISAHGTTPSSSPGKLADSAAKTNGNEVVATQSYELKPNPFDLSDIQKKQECRKRLAQARQHLEAGQLDESTRLAAEAEAYEVSGRSWNPFSDSPAKVKRDIQRARAKSQRGSRPTLLNRGGGNRTEALDLLKQGRAHLSAGELDLAEQYASQAQAKSSRFRLFDDTPNRLLSDVARARTAPSVKQAVAKKAAKTVFADDVLAVPAKRPEGSEAAVRNVANQQLQNARTYLSKGDYKNAYEIARRVQGWQLSYSLWSDNPDKIMRASRTMYETRGSQPGVIAQTSPTVTDPAVPKLEQTAPAPKSIADAPALTFEPEDVPDSTPPSTSVTQAANQQTDESQSTQLIPVVRGLDDAPSEVSNILNGVRSESLGGPSNIGRPKGISSEVAQRKLQQAEKLYEVGNYARARELANEAGRDPNLNTAAAELKAKADFMEHGVALKLFEAGESALRKGESTRALEFFRQVAAGGTALPPQIQHRLRGYLRDLPSQIKQAGYQEGNATVQDGNPTPPGTLRESGDLDRVKFEQLVAKTNSSIQKAKRVLPVDPRQAVRELQTTREEVTTADIPDNLRMPLVRRIDVAIRYTNQEKQRIELEQVQEQSNVALAEQKKRELLVNTQRQEEIKELITQAEALSDEGDFANAELTARRALELDSDNLAAQAVHTKSKVERQLQIQRKIREDFGERYKEVFNDIDTTAIPDNRDISYIDAPEWADLTERRRKLQAELEQQASTPLELEIKRKLEDPITFDFEQTPLAEVVDFLKDFTGVNIVVDHAAILGDGLVTNQPVTLQLKQVPLKSALKHMLKQLNLTYVIDADVLMITTPLSVKSELRTTSYPVGDLVIQIPNFGPNPMGAMGVGPAGAASFGQGTTLGKNPIPSVGLGQFGTNEMPFENSSGFQPAFTHEKNQKGSVPPGAGQNVDFDALIELIEATIEPDTWSSVGGEGTIEEFAPNLSLVISQTQEVHEQIADLLTQLRRLQDLQVSVEVKFITLTENFFERIGIDFDINLQSNAEKPLRNFGSVIVPGGTAQGGGGGGAGATQTPPVRNFIYNDHDDDVTVGLNTGAGGAIGPQTIIPNFANDLKIPIRTGGFGNARPSSFVTGDGLSFGVAFLSDIEVFLFLEAAQRNDRSNVLLAPKITLFNGALGFVFSGTLEPFVTALTPVVQSGAISFDPTITQIFNGSGLVVQAVISADRRYVRLTVQPFFNSIAGERRFQISGAAAGGGGGIGGGAGAIGISTDLVVPIIATNIVSTTVSVPDGGTVLLGGLKSKSETRNEFGTPILNKIPYINRLFMETGLESDTSSLLLMVTPRIIIQEEEEELLGKTSTLAF